MKNKKLNSHAIHDVAIELNGAEINAARIN